MQEAVKSIANRSARVYFQQIYFACVFALSASSTRNLSGYVSVFLQDTVPHNTDFVVNDKGREVQEGEELKENDTVSLLDYLGKQLGDVFISNIKYDVENKKRIAQIVNDIAEESFSEKEWKETCQYITGKSVESAKEAKEILGSL